MNFVMKQCLICIALLGWLTTQAQTLQVRSNVTQDSNPFRIGVAVGDLEWLRGRFAVGVSSDGGSVAFEVRNRINLSLGPIANAIFISHLYLDSRGRYDLDIDAEGAGGAALAARVRLGMYNVNPGYFRLAEAYHRDSRPLYYFADDGKRGGYGVHLGIGASYRLSRTVVIELEPQLTFGSSLKPNRNSEFYGLRSGGIGAQVDAAMVFRRIIERDDAAIRARWERPFASDRSHIGIGGEYILKRPEVPTIALSAWLVRYNAKTSAALYLDVREDIGELELALRAMVEPFRQTVPYRIAIEASSPLAAGELHGGLYLAPQSKLLPHIGAEVSYHFRF